MDSQPASDLIYCRKMFDCVEESTVRGAGRDLIADDGTVLDGGLDHPVRVILYSRHIEAH
jgi:hypothetical protein